MGGVEVSAETVERIAKQRQGGRIIAVGTTVVRAEGQLNLVATTVLRQDELVYLSRLPVACVEGLITNFHLPLKR